MSQAPADQHWSTRGAAEVLISDAEPLPAADCGAEHSCDHGAERCAKHWLAQPSPDLE